MKDRIINFLKIYVVFISFVLVVNLSMELLFSPENRKIIADYGWSYFVQHQLMGIIVFFALFSCVGAFLYLKTSYEPKRMGLLSFIVGFVLEFAFMRPDWVQNIYAVNIGGDVIVALIVSSLYWFVTWGAPSYIIHKLALLPKL